MKQYKITFTLNPAEKIIMISQDPFEKLRCCYDILILYVQNNQQKFELYNDDILNGMRILKNLLQEALNRILQLHVSINLDIGFLYNEYCDYIWNKDLKRNNKFAYVKVENQEQWVGMRYHLWEKDYISWIYNDKDGSIIFEATPLYPYFSCEPEDGQNYIPYDQWIQNYKPYLTRKIPKKVAQQWYKQAHNIIVQIEENISHKPF